MGGGVIMIIINKNGRELDFTSATLLMDNEIREALHAELAPCSEQEYFTEYEKRHEDRFNKIWELSKSNPVW